MYGWPVERIETERRRLEVLRYLAQSPGYEAAAGLLRLHCVWIGVPTTFDQSEGCVAWLAEQGLVTLRRNNDEPIARLTRAGREVADGSRAAPGVLRPDP